MSFLLKFGEQFSNDTAREYNQTLYYLVSGIGIKIDITKYSQLKFDGYDVAEPEPDITEEIFDTLKRESHRVNNRVRY